MGETIGIVGRGLIGRSIELRLQRIAGHDLIALDRGDDLARLAGAEIIFLCAPIPENIRLLAALPSHVPGTALVTDTGSTKRTTVAAARTLPSRLRFIGGHPVAGAASGGPRADLFDGRPWILTPEPEAGASDVAGLRALIEAMGATVHTLDPAEHDRVFACVSHLPQLAVSALMNAVGEAVGADGLALAGAGLRDSTRLAASPGELWRTIVDSNADYVDAALDRLIAELQALREHHEQLPARFERAGRWKRTLDASRPL